jgi:hypothetical protein
VPTTPPEEKPSWFSKQLLHIVEKLDDSDKGSLGGYLKEYIKKKETDSAATSQADSGFGSLSKYFPSEMVNDIGSWFSQLKVPSLPNVGPAMPPQADVSVGTGGASAMESVTHVAIGALVVVLAGVLIWKLMGLKNALAGKEGNPWHVGAWPVQPSAVQTRADLVKAFEYLAVLLLGPGARARHHLELAEELGQQTRAADARRSEAARTLAYLYELARYTPENETLPPDELATARRELSFLAGAAPA